MSSYDINDHEIQLVCMNTDVINVDYWALNRLDFKTCGETHTFDKNSKRMDVSIELERLYLDIDITDPRHFRHVPRLADEDSIRLDGESCLAHIRNVPDITHIRVNGILYKVPWEYESYRTAMGSIAYKNKLQQISEMKTFCTDDNTFAESKWVAIEVMRKSNAVDIYNNQGVEDGKVNLPDCEGADAG